MAKSQIKHITDCMEHYTSNQKEYINRQILTMLTVQVNMLKNPSRKEK